MKLSEHNHIYKNPDDQASIVNRKRKYFTFYKFFLYCFDFISIHKHSKAVHPRYLPIRHLGSALGIFTGKIISVF